MLSITSPVSPQSATVTGIASTPGAHSSKSFVTVLGTLATETNLGMPKSIVALEKKLDVGTAVSPQELLSAQITIHKFNLKVEMLSKGVESLVSTAKRLQQQS